MNAPANPFELLSAINVNEHVEKKGSLSYLSWPWAVATLLKHDPDANWTYLEPKSYGATMMVGCTVKAFGKERTCWLPVMDHRNKAIANPDAFAVNTAMQRCLVKGIALHGLGLYIYAGEDLPAGEEDKKDPAVDNVHKANVKPTAGLWEALTPDQRNRLTDLALIMQEACNVQDYSAAYEMLDRAGLDTDERAALNTRFDSKTRSAMAAWRKTHPADYVQA